MERALPAGTVTFLFTDVEGSTQLLHELGAERYADALAEHRRILRAAFGARGGVEVDTQGDAFFIAFPTAPAALAAAVAATEELAHGPIRVRMGIHSGTPLLTDEGYVGVDVHRAARIASAGHGGQILVSTAAAGLVEPDALHDLGEHRLKDLSAPERIYQVGSAEFPPLKSLYRTNLPVPATPFLGRADEVDELADLLRASEPRLLTLTGPGGVGKTRLALQAAGAAADGFADGVYWVPLAPLDDPQLVLPTVAQALGAEQDVAGHIADRVAPARARQLRARDRRGRATSPALLTACPRLHVLVTSREVLRLPGEQAYPVTELRPDEGVELFLSRAHAADPSFAASDGVAALCARLEQLPLALELAAARVRVLSPAQLLDRLSSRLDLLKAGRGVDPRQQTLRATIEWSHELLDADEQAGLRTARRLRRRLDAARGRSSDGRRPRRRAVARRQEPRARPRARPLLHARDDPRVRCRAARATPPMRTRCADATPRISSPSRKPRRPRSRTSGRTSGSSSSRPTCRTSAPRSRGVSSMSPVRRSGSRMG